MTKKKLIWQIFTANLLILSITVISVAWFGKTSLKSFYLAELEKDLVARAYLVKPGIIEMVQQKALNKLRQFSKTSGRESSTRITVILSGGEVVADSNENSETMESHHNRVEFVDALQGEVGKSLRFSRTLGQEMLYVAIPLYNTSTTDLSPDSKSSISAVLRLSVPVVSIEGALQRISSRLLFAIFIIVLLAALASFLLSRNISKPLEEMKKAAERFSKGDFKECMSALQGKSASLEIATLSASMDRMAEELDAKIETIKSQRYELETVFSSMVESVIAVDRDEKVININKAAANLLEVNRETAKGRIVQEVLRNIDLQKQIDRVLQTGDSVEDEIVHHDSTGERFLQTNLVSLNDEKDNVLGILVVMNDVTRLRRLENMRRDFVANVSHELRTPITSIRGYVETLLDGAMENKEDGARFLEVVLRQSERLNEIIEDLLVLSRIEQQADNGLIKLMEGNLCMVLDVAKETCEHKAECKKVEISLECHGEILVDMNDTLIEQAVVNLLVNAIKYSEEGGEVKVIAKEKEEAGLKQVEIKVIDTGIGIASKHLPRLFERFYRSDKARSRQHGGTGLGLAIVKHIAQAHGGQINVISTEGSGSTFTIVLPGTKRI